MDFLTTIGEQMALGNFSFAILVVGIIQCMLMITSLLKKK